ncbi:LuxR family transcriptional regulator [Spirillospora sp. NPDC029432]|uniref:LuxR family transcriptional regulator n=1 Tax=Spirillospora sp. NPDC029432 TaxID=3154599 RepID=UPI00345527FE
MPALGTAGLSEAPPGGAAPAVLYGRDRELAVLAEVLDAARTGRGGALAVVGGLGMGKSALLAAAAGRSGEGFRVLRVRGVRQEGSVPYAGLHRLLRPLANVIERLPRHHAAALAPVTGGGTETAPFALYAAVCSLLSEAAAERPVLCWIDDAHRLDRVSLEALAFAARRIPDVPVAMLFATRKGHPASAVRGCLADLPRLALGPLDEADAVRVLESLARGNVDEELATEVVELAGGNPLALAEFAAAFTPDQLAGNAPPPRALPARSVLRAHYRRRYLRLTSGARRLVLLAAADDRLDVGTLARAASEDGIDLRELEWARASGLIRIDGDRLEMPAPPARSSLYADASPAERRAVHELLARVLDRGWHAPRRCWHRAALADGPDEALAADLAESAESLQSVSRHAEAARSWQRSAELTADPETRADRYIAAASASWKAGRMRRARAMLRQVRPCTSDPGRLGRAALLQGEIEMVDGLPVMALWILQEAAGHLADVDPPQALTALLQASAAADTTGDRHCHRDLVQRAIALAERSSPSASPIVEFVHCYFAGMRAAALREPDEAYRRLRRVLELADEVADGSVKSWAATAAMVLGDDRRARDLAARAVAGTRDREGAVMEPRALGVLAHCEVLLGRYPAAESTAREGLRLARAAGQRNQVIEQRALLALLAAFRGDRDTALGHLDGLAEEGGQRELVRATSLETWAMACLDLADDRPADAAARLRHPVGSASGHPMLRLLAIPHFVEAAVRAGRPDDARRAFAAFERWASLARGPGRPALAERCRALLAEDDEAAAEHFEAALRRHEDGDSPLEMARTALLYGHRLRRGRRPRDARPHLRNAAQIFQRSGAATWAARARAELRAAGETLDDPGRPEESGPLAELTAQQLQIARLVAGGATNREIAAQLVISPRTVDGHLRNIFARLGIRSRIELAHLFIA